MAVTAISEQERARPPLRLMTTDDAAPDRPDTPELPVKPTPPVRNVVQVAFPTAQVVAVIGLLTKVLATRMILLAAGLGAFFLAMVVVQHPSWQAMVSCGLYDLFVFGPCLYLALRRE